MQKAAHEPLFACCGPLQEGVARFPMAEVPHTAEHHCHAAFVGRVDDFLVAHGAAWLDHAGCACIHHHIKAQHAGLSLAGTVVASDAFFPFRDGLDVVVDAGATCVIQPGGSMRDQEVIDAADARGVAMVFSGVRHFRH